MRKKPSRSIISSLKVFLRDNDYIAKKTEGQVQGELMLKREQENE